MGLPFGNNEEGAHPAVERVKHLVQETGLPEFRSFGVREDDLREIAENSARNGSNADNPRPMGTEDYLVVLKRLMG